MCLNKYFRLEYIHRNCHRNRDFHLNLLKIFWYQFTKNIYITASYITLQYNKRYYFNLIIWVAIFYEENAWIQQLFYTNLVKTLFTKVYKRKQYWHSNTTAEKKLIRLLIRKLNNDLIYSRLVCNRSSYYEIL